MILAHKICLDPTSEQIAYFKRACGTARFVWNWALERWNAEYADGKKPNGMATKKAFHALYKTEYPWVSEVHRDCHSQPFANLQTAFRRFFKGKAKRPVFHKKGRKDSFYVANDRLKVDGMRIRLPIVGWVRTKEKLRFNGQVQSATVSRTANKWFVSVQVEMGKYRKQRLADNRVGIDLGLNNFATLSNGETIQAPKPLKRGLKKLCRVQRVLSRRVMGSANRRKQADKAARVHARIANIRTDFLHKLTTRLCRENQAVSIEDLNVSGMIRNRKLSRAISDVGWGEFRRQLEYKAEIYDTDLTVTNRWEPTSKRCSSCGYIKPALKLSEREYECENCGTVIDRDCNAAINILAWATREVTPVERLSSLGEAGTNGTQKCIPGRWQI